MSCPGDRVGGRREASQGAAEPWYAPRGVGTVRAMPTRSLTALVLLLFLATALAACGPTRRGGGGGDDDDSGTDDDDFGDDDDDFGDDDDVSVDDDDAASDDDDFSDDDDLSDDDDDAAGSYSGTTSGSLELAGSPFDACAGTIELSVSGNSISGSGDCMYSLFPTSCDLPISGTLSGGITATSAACGAFVGTVNLSGATITGEMSAAVADKSLGDIGFFVEFSATED